MKKETTKTERKSMLRQARALTTGAAVSAMMIFTTPAVQAQSGPPLDTQPPVADNAGEISHQAKMFLQEAAQADQSEIALANIAELRSQNPTVKELAQMIRGDHQKNFAELEVIAQNHHVALDLSLDVMNQHAVNKLQKVSDADFDKDYTTMMLKGHVKCIKMFDKAVEHIEDLGIREYAQNTLPVLHKHLQHSRDAARAVGVDEGTITSILRGLPSEDMDRKVSLN
jgi:putative membrane protein